MPERFTVCGLFDALSVRVTAAIVFISDSEQMARTTHDFLRAVFGLTPAECRVALLLGDGKSPREIAELLALSRNTVKSRPRPFTRRRARPVMFNWCALCCGCQGVRLPEPLSHQRRPDVVQLLAVSSTSSPVQPGEAVPSKFIQCVRAPRQLLLGSWEFPLPSKMIVGAG